MLRIMKHSMHNGANKTDAGNGSEAICRVSNVLPSPSPDPRRSADNEMNTYSQYVVENDIDYEKVLQGGGQNHGDEDFAVFGCPSCHHVYLLEYEVDTVFIDARDLTKRILVFDSGFKCVSCGIEIPYGVAWIGPKAGHEFRVRYDDMLMSEWAWILNKRA